MRASAFFLNFRRIDPPAAMRLNHRILPVPAALALAASLAACGSGISLDEPIEGPRWRLVQLGEQSIAPGAEPARDPHLQFEPNGRVSGSGGCNRLSGSFTRSHSQLRLGQLASTRMACAEAERGALETRFFQALQGTASYRLQGPGRLALLDAGGRTLATFDSTPAR